MASVDVLTKEGSKVNSIELNQDIFGIEPNQHVLFEAVNLQRASLRRGTHSVKNRSAVSGGGKKPFRQKEQVMHVKVQSVHLTIVEVEWYSALRQEATLTKCLEKCAVWLFAQRSPQKSMKKH